MQDLFIGVDGGATKTSVRIEDTNGRLLSKATSGPANIRISVPTAWESITAGITTALQALSSSLTHPQLRLHVGIGVAGCELEQAYAAFTAQQPLFTHLTISSDSHIACLGAHNGQDGAIIIAGTGAVGFQSEQGQLTKVSGWGFPHDDEGSGAYLGLEAVKHSLQCLDKRAALSSLATAVFTHFHNDQNALVAWANAAHSADFATLAPLVISAYEQQDEAACAIMQRAAHAIDKIAAALAAQQRHSPLLPCTFLGGVAPFLQPLLNPHLQARLKPCAASPDAGAIFLIRAYLARQELT